MTDKIEIKSAPHRKIAVADILPNPHRDLEANPISEERVDGLIESFERTGFWDNIVVREHPTREGKYQLAYGHNRLAALKNKKKIDVDSITIPVAKLNDWDMYCCMVDENELAGRLSPEQAMENINVGCDMIEAALKRIGEKGSWEEFNAEIGRVVSIGTTLDKKRTGFGFEQARNAYWEGKGLGRRFVTDYLPTNVRANTLHAILAARYDTGRVSATAKKAKEKREQAARETNAAKAAKLRAEAQKLEDEAKRIGKGIVAKDVLLLFKTPNHMTDFAEAIKRLGIPTEVHKDAAEFIISGGSKQRTDRDGNPIPVLHDAIITELNVWWDHRSGAAAARVRQAKRKAEREKLERQLKGVNFSEFITGIANSLGEMMQRLETAAEYGSHVDAKARKQIEGKITKAHRLLGELIRKSNEVGDMKDVTPVTQLLLTN